jgi:hypothetical protein
MAEVTIEVSVAELVAECVNLVKEVQNPTQPEWAEQIFEQLETVRVQLTQVRFELARLTAAEGETANMVRAEFDALAADVNTLRTTVTDTGTNLQEAIDRISDNPTPDEINALREVVSAAASDLTNLNTTIDSIDPEIPGGSVPPDDGTEEPPVEGEEPV